MRDHPIPSCLLVLPLSLSLLLFSCHLPASCLVLSDLYLLVLVILITGAVSTSGNSGALNFGTGAASSATSAGLLVQVVLPVALVPALEA
jgi:hypothetical protein